MHQGKWQGGSYDTGYWEKRSLNLRAVHAVDPSAHSFHMAVDAATRYQTERTGSGPRCSKSESINSVYPPSSKTNVADVRVICQQSGQQRGDFIYLSDPCWLRLSLRQLVADKGT